MPFFADAARDGDDATCAATTAQQHARERARDDLRHAPPRAFAQPAAVSFTAADIFFSDFSLFTRQFR